jgi:phasin
MNEQFTRQAQEMFNAAREARIPENVQHIAEESVIKTREAYSRVATATKDGVRVFEDVVLASQAGAKTIGEKMLNNTLANTEAAFDAAQAIARARSVQEVARLQADFMQQQYAVATAQTKELFELSSKFARQAFETMGQASNRSFDQFRR